MSKKKKATLFAVLSLIVTFLVPFISSYLLEYKSKPNIWKSEIISDNGGNGLTDDFYFPEKIYLNSLKENFTVVSEEFNFEFYIQNRHDYEMLFSSPQLELGYYAEKYPYIEIGSEIVEQKYKIKIHNISDKEEKSLKIVLTDKDKKFDSVLKDDNVKEIDILESNGIEEVICFDINHFFLQANVSSVSPIITITDMYGNILEYHLDKIVFLPEESIIEIPNMGDLDRFFYDITNDIKQNNEKVDFNKLELIIPKSETTVMDYYISSQIPCAMKFGLKYNIDQKIYHEDIGNIIFYYPTGNSGIKDNSEYLQDLNQYKNKSFLDRDK